MVRVTEVARLIHGQTLIDPSLQLPGRRKSTENRAERQARLR